MAITPTKLSCFPVLLAGLLMLIAGPSLAAKKVALVIGTDSYQNLPVLQKAVNDARAITQTLTNIGFEVIKGENLTRRQMNRSLANLERTISPGDQVFFFFAGHGVALGATNYLIPSDMPLPDTGEESLVRGEAFAVDQIVERIRARGAVASFVVLDACRNNPFKTKGVRSIGSSRGLRDISAPKGVFVLFSAGIGQTALDRLHDNDKNPNSVFTRNLVPLLKQPGLSHVQLAKQVQSDVDKLARTIRHEQQPAYYDQVIGNMYLVESETKSELKEAPKTKTVTLKKSDVFIEAKTIYNDIKDSRDIKILEIFARQFPNSVYSKFALSKIETLREANLAKNSSLKRIKIKEKNVPTVEPESPRVTSKNLVRQAHAAYRNKNYIGALGLYMRAGNRGQTDILYNIGLMFMEGKGTKKDYTEAARYFRKAISNNDTNAMYVLAKLHITGKGVSPDINQAAALVYKSLKNKNQFALNEMNTNSNQWPTGFRKELQRLLKKNGYYSGVIDGKLGEASKNAINELAGRFNNTGNKRKNITANQNEFFVISTSKYRYSRKTVKNSDICVVSHDIPAATHSLRTIMLKRGLRYGFILGQSRSNAISNFANPQGPLGCQFIIADTESLASSVFRDVKKKLKNRSLVYHVSKL